MPGKDYYAILGVSKTSSEDEIKKSFRRLAHEHHPDKGGDQKKFKDINEAYQVLGDKSKRSTYDQFGSAAFEQPAGAGSGFAGGFDGFNGVNVNFEDLGGLGDIFGEMFGFQTGGRQKTRRGSDIEIEVSIDFLEAVRGAAKPVKLYRHDACSVCSGSGSEPDSVMEKCKTCNGKGQVSRATRTMFGTIQSAVTCPECHGKGEKPTKLCKHCSGTGVERKTTEISVPIPAGISDGEAIRITGQGEFPGSGGKAGDLFVRVHVKPHSTFDREGNDVISMLRVPYTTLLLGGEVPIETVDGSGSLTIPENTPPGTVFKLRGKGFHPVHGGNRGDHLVTVQPLVPKKLSREQRKSLEDLRNAGL